MSRYFIAAWPSASVRDVLAALPRTEATGLRWTTADQWHVTLRFLGAVDEDAARASLRRVEAKATVAVLGPRTERLSPQILVVPVRGLDGVAEAVLAATADLGDAPHPDGFRGHLTLARQRTGTTSSADGLAVSGSFPVDEIALVRSELRADGARYAIVARRDLSPR